MTNFPVSPKLLRLICGLALVAAALSVLLACGSEEPTRRPRSSGDSTPLATPTVEPTERPAREPTATPTMAPTPTPTRTPTPEPTPTATQTPAPTTAQTPTMAPTGTPVPTATLVPTPVPDPTATPAPTATPVPETGWVLTQSIAIHRAAYGGTPADVEKFLESGEDINAGASIRHPWGFEYSGVTPLYLAATFNPDLDVALLLLEWGANPEEVTTYGPENTIIDRGSPLHWAAAYNPDPAATEQLLEWGANLEYDEGDTPLMWAASYNPNPAVTELLLEWGADVNSRHSIETGGTGDTVLHNAVFNPNPAVVELLLDHGANIEAREGVGYTPLHKAANGALSVMELLLDRGADIEAQGHKNQTPLFLGLQSPQVFKALLERGANIEAIDSHGRTPLFYAVEVLGPLRAEYFETIGSEYAKYNTPERDAEVVKRLLDNGANVEVEVNGWRPLHYAAYSGQEGIAEALLEAGADRKAKNNQGQTACQIARDRGNFTGLLLGSLCRP